MSDAIRLAGLSFRWPNRPTPCLKIEGWQVAEQERIFLHGDSGSGKSTLLNLIGGVLRPEHGTLHLLGHDLTTLPAAALDRFRVDHIGFIFQQFNLIPYLSLLDNVLLPCRFSRRRAARAAAQGGSPRDEALRLLAALDIDPTLAGHPAAEISVGQQQRVAVARALIGRPEIIMADEPTSALDATRQAQFVDLLMTETAAAGSALLFVSHDQRLAGHFDRQVRLADINSAATEPPRA